MPDPLDKYGPLHHYSATKHCMGGRNDTGDWERVNCPDCLKSHPKIGQYGPWPEDQPYELLNSGLYFKPHDLEHQHCLKCHSPSGDNWSQCEGACPVRSSPHFDEALLNKLVAQRTKKVLPSTIKALKVEVTAARTKFPGTDHAFDALVEEVGELAKVLLQGRGREAVMKEAIQCAAVAIRIYEEGDSSYDNRSPGKP